MTKTTRYLAIMAPALVGYSVLTRITDCGGYAMVFLLIAAVAAVNASALANFVREVIHELRTMPLRKKLPVIIQIILGAAMVSYIALDEPGLTETDAYVICILSGAAVVAAYASVLANLAKQSINALRKWKGESR